VLVSCVTLFTRVSIGQCGSPSNPKAFKYGNCTSSSLASVAHIVRRNYVLELRRRSISKFHSTYFALRSWLTTSFRFGGCILRREGQEGADCSPRIKVDWNAVLQAAIRVAALFGLAGETAPVVSENVVTTGSFA